MTAPLLFEAASAGSVAPAEKPDAPVPDPQHDETTGTSGGKGTVHLITPAETREVILKICLRATPEDEVCCVCNGSLAWPRLFATSQSQYNNAKAPYRRCRDMQG